MCRSDLHEFRDWCRCRKLLYRNNLETKHTLSDCRVLPTAMPANQASSPGFTACGSSGEPALAVCALPQSGTCGTDGFVMVSRIAFARWKTKIVDELVLWSHRASLLFPLPTCFSEERYENRADINFECASPIAAGRVRRAARA